MSLSLTNSKRAPGLSTGASGHVNANVNVNMNVNMNLTPMPNT